MEKFRGWLSVIVLAIGFCLPLDAQDIFWTEISGSHDLPTGVRLFAGTRSYPVLEAWYLEVDLNVADLAIQPYLRSSPTTVPTFCAAVGAIAAVNGGYFGGTTSYSAVVQPGQVLAQNVGAVTRNGQSYPVMRSFFGLNQDFEAAVDWIYHFGGSSQTIYRYEEPLPYVENQGTPLAPPVQGDGTAMTDLLLGIGGGPTLINDGTIDISYAEEIFWGSGVGYDNRDPRTAVGATSDNRVILLVADGRQSQSDGLNLWEMATVLQGLGCVEAMNLDGGGSTQMAVGGSYVNSPSEYRSVPSILAVVPRDSLNIVAAPAYELIIDSQDFGFELEGNDWFPTANAGFYGETPSLLNQFGDGSDRAVFHFTLGTPALDAEVWAWWVASSNRCTDTPIIISHADGVDTVRVNQRENHARWNSLGTYRFNADTPYSVTVSDDVSTLQYVVADAIRITSETPLEPTAVNEHHLESGPNAFGLLPLFPNPANEQVTLRLRHADQAPVVFRIYDLRGNLVDEWSRMPPTGPGVFSCQWPRVGSNANVTSGIYIIAAQQGAWRQVRRFAVIR